MKIQELFVRSNEELLKVIDQIKDDQWDIELPTSMSRHPANLKKTVNYHAYDDAWVADVLAGKTIQEVGDKYEAILSSDNPKVEYDKQNQLAIAAVRDYTDLDKIVHLSYGDFTAKDYLQHIISFRGFRVYDLASLIGANTTMADDLVQGLWDELSPFIEGFRRMGVFPAAVEVPANADLQTKLLGLAGRNNLK